MRKPIVDVKYNINHNGTNYCLKNLKWESDHTDTGFHWVENLFNNDTKELVFDKDLVSTIKAKLFLDYSVLTHI